MNQSDRLARIEGQLVERTRVAERDAEIIREQFKELSEKLDKIAADVRNNRAEHDKIVNRGWGILISVTAVAGAIGAVVKSLFLDWAK